MPSTFNVILLVGLGLAPSLFWLSFFLLKDSHPEPRYLLSSTFLMGMILAPVALGLQWAFAGLGGDFYSDIFSLDSVYFFLWAALVEEVVKFLAIKFLILNSPEFDEPIDAIMYMITASLGFAAIENILFLFKFTSIENILFLFKFTSRESKMFWDLWSLRSIGAIPLHALAGALTGYFLALAWFYRHHSKKLIATGIVLAGLFHFVFNILIVSAGDNYQNLLFAFLWLGVLAILIGILFHKIRARSLIPPTEPT